MFVCLFAPRIRDTLNTFLSFEFNTLIFKNIHVIILFS